MPPCAKVCQHRPLNLRRCFIFALILATS
jgi:hypothetical protein